MLNTVRWAVLVVTGSILLCVMPVPSVGAFTWVNDIDPNVEHRVTSRDDSGYCAYQKIDIENIDPVDACVSTAENYQFAAYHNTKYAIRFNNQQEFHNVTGIPAGIYNYGSARILPMTNGLVVLRPEGWNDKNLLIYKNFTTKLVPYVMNKSTHYLFDGGLPDYRLNNTDGTPAPIHEIAFSDNNKWLIAAQTGAVLVRINLETFETKVISKEVAALSGGMVGAVSDDGKYIATSMWNLYGGLKMYEVKDNCAGDITELTFTTYERKTYCPSKSLVQYIEQYFDGPKPALSHMQFFRNGARLEVRGVSKSLETAVVTLDIPNVKEPFRLEYLALGDSYSSGEGDVGRRSDGTKYYKTGTDTGIDDCHISERSYTFVLKEYYRYGDNTMQSIACSGARLVYDYNSKNENYHGQGDRAKHLSQSELAAKQASSLEKFIPGYVQQIEFVKKYQPEILSFTAGGNDVGFSDILQYCATGVMIGIIPVYLNETCEYATEGSHHEKILYNSVDTQYHYTNEFVKKIKIVSPGTNIVLIGYPTFISDHAGRLCNLNAGLINDRERKMINKAVARLNNMLKKVAYDNNINYVDVEDSLVGGRMCEGGEYVTGLHQTGLKAENRVEAFHPNAKGHEKIAERIKLSNSFLYKLPLEVVEYEPSRDLIVTEQKNIIPDGLIHKSSKTTGLHLEAGTLKPSSTAKIKMYSEEIDIGNVIVDKDGSLSLSLDTSQLPLGRHLAVLSGQLASGDPVEYYQFITVSFNEVDNDNDGIPNEQDVCDFVQHLYSEDGHDICSTDINSGVSMQSDINYTKTMSTKARRSNKVSFAPREDFENVAINLMEQKVVYGGKRAVTITEQLNDSLRNRYDQLYLYGIVIVLMMTGGVYAYKRSKK